MTVTVTAERWRKAQGAELDFWTGMEFYELVKACAEKAEFWSRFDPAQIDTMIAGKRVLEIGCGPLGLSVVSFCDATPRELIKTDPLARLPVRETRAARNRSAAHFIDWVEELAAVGDYLQIAGEDLAYDSTFDTVITYNVLDHVRSPLRILENARRALRPGGCLILGVDCLSWLGRIRFEWITRRVARGTILVEAHPHTFLPGDVTRMIEAAGLQMTAVHGLPRRLSRFAGRHFRPAFIATK
jgi:2-polyprenyl-3-methyl-5-hydroxy-6-metoxy-1,4-benzoquinol methylase